jgi:hypothetical protein
MKDSGLVNLRKERRRAATLRDLALKELGIEALKISPPLEEVMNPPIPEEPYVQSLTNVTMIFEAVTDSDEPFFDDLDDPS